MKPKAASFFVSESDCPLPDGVRRPKSAERKNRLQGWHHRRDEGTEEGVRESPYFHSGNQGNNRGKTRPCPD